MKTPDLPVVEPQDWQEQAKESFKAAQTTGHRVMLVSIGCVGIAVDVMRAAYASTSQLISNTEQRGAQLERDMKKLRGRAQNAVDQVNQEVAQRGQAAEREVERQIEQVRDRLPIPSREEVEKLGNEFDALGAKIDQELAKGVSAVAEAPWPGYDSMNAEMLVAKLQSLDNESLLRAQRYEQEHKHRVTVLRELDRLLYAYSDDAG